jgi:hypothetical protein
MIERTSSGGPLMPLFINLHPGGALLEDVPAETAVALALDERSAKTLAALLALESFELSAALGQLWLAGCREGHRSSRRVPQPGNS